MQYQRAITILLLWTLLTFKIKNYINIKQVIVSNFNDHKILHYIANANGKLKKLLKKC